MPGGKYDSSKTRVAPVFEQLQKLTNEWVRNLLALPQYGHPLARFRSEPDLNFIFQYGYWGSTELGLPPAPLLLEWLVRNPQQLRHATSANPDRQKLLEGDPDALQRALDGLRSGSRGRLWYVLEGDTFPDAVIMTPGAIVVVEGKRTEAGPTIETSWLAGRHQIWRHIEAAWETRGAREVFGLFIVEGDADGIPEVWRQAAKASYSAATLETSFPHRSTKERDAIASCFLGVTTWQEVCRTIGIEYSKLPSTVDDLPAGRRT